MLGTLVCLCLIGGVFTAGGLETYRKPPYPYRWLEASFQITVGIGSLLAAILIILGTLLFFIRRP